MGKLIDLIGHRFGNLVVIQRMENDKFNNGMWKCKCDCGNEIIVRSALLRGGRTGNCGCKKRMRLDLTSRVFGELTIIRNVDSNINKDTMWLCKCSCGKEVELTYNQIVHERIRSCGCTKYVFDHHHMSGTALFRAIKDIRNRCYNPNTKYYPDYGGRGIKVCDEWMDKEHGISNFIKWSYENGYKEGLSIDRIDNDGDYTPENCRWTTASVQMFNRRKPKSKLGVRGVHEYKGRFYSSITVNYKNIALGGYATLDEAAAARKAAELKYYGQVLQD